MVYERLAKTRRNKNFNSANKKCPNNEKSNIAKICMQIKETKGRSSGQTNFTLKPKQLDLKKTYF